MCLFSPLPPIFLATSSLRRLCRFINSLFAGPPSDSATFVHRGGKKKKPAIIIRARKQHQQKQEEPQRGLAEGSRWGKRTAQTLQQPPITIAQDKQAWDRAIRLQGQRPGRVGPEQNIRLGKATLCARYTCGRNAIKPFNTKSESNLRMLDRFRRRTTTRELLGPVRDENSVI